MRPPKHNPTKPHCFLTQHSSNPEASRPPQESLVRDETRTSLPAKPSLTRPTLGQLCVAPRTSQSRPAATEPLVAQLALRCSALDLCATWEHIQLKLEWLEFFNHTHTQTIVGPPEWRTRDSGFAPRLCRNRPRPVGPWGDAEMA